MKDPIDLIEEMLIARGWTRRYLLPVFGGLRSRMSEAMTRTRPLSVRQIRCLVFNYGMNAEDMIRWYPTKMQPTEPRDVFDDVLTARGGSTSDGEAAPR